MQHGRDLHRNEGGLQFGGGLGGFQDDSDRIVIGSGQRVRRAQHDDMVLERNNMSMFTEKLAAIIGPSYLASFFVGGALGLTKVPPPKARRTYRLLVTNYLNNIGKTSSRFGNNVGGGIFLYLMVGKSLNFIFREELENFNEMQRSALFGAVTGSLYKCTRGVRPMILGAVLGSLAGSAYTYSWERGWLKVQV